MVRPLQVAKHDECFFSAWDGVRLFFRSDVPESPRAHVAVVHGFGDHSGRYHQMTAALVADGFAVHAFDYRGHGQAGGRRGDCQNWSDYVSDLELFLKRARAAAGRQKLFVFAHSHGALMLVHYLTADAEFPGVVLSSPYLGLALKPSAPKLAAAKFLGKVAPWVNIPSGIRYDQITSDPERQAADKVDPLHGINPTPRWFVQSTRAQEEALALGPKIVLPLLILCAGEDQIASTPTARGFLDSVGSKDKQFKEYPGMQHEVWNERGREQVWRDISLWIQERL